MKLNDRGPGGYGRTIAVLQGRLPPERCSNGWRKTGAVRQWIRNLSLAFFFFATIDVQTYYDRDNLLIHRNESSTFTGKAGCVLGHVDRRADERDHKLELIAVDADRGGALVHSHI